MQKEQRTHGIIWFRNNLRVKDNSGLNTAVEECKQVTAVYIFDPRQYELTPWGFPRTGSHRFKFLIETLKALKTELRSCNIPIHFEIGKPENIIPLLAVRWDAEAIYTQKEWTAEEDKVNNDIKRQIHIPFRESYDQFLIDPGDLPFQDINELPEIFTQFRKAVEASWKVRPLTSLRKTPLQIKIPEGLTDTLPHPEGLGLTMTEPDHRSAFPFPGGTDNALQRIEHYFWKTGKLQYYKRTRNGLLGPDYSSKLSPWLANGSISPKMIYYQVKAFESEVIANQDTYWLIFELLWRDYFKFMAMKHGDRIFQTGGIKQRNYEWGYDEACFMKWKEGRTGNDFVDANMVELLRTGWMSNRGRQNVASYWAKDLGQDWRVGAYWFESLLVDYDVHSNWGNWNYVSGVGNDPRDRKFNTRTQAERYDSSGNYRQLWLQNSLF